MTATVVAKAGATSSVVTIPQYVRNNGKTYEVVAIGEGAFQNNTSITEVVLPSSVKKVSDNAFSGCSKLEEIDLSNVEYFATNALDDTAWYNETEILDGVIYNGQIVVGTIYNDEDNPMPENTTLTSLTKVFISSIIA